MIYLKLEKDEVLQLIEKCQYPLEQSTIDRLQAIFFSYDNIVPASFDVIVVLCSSSINRIQKAIELYQQKRVPILISGNNYLEKDQLMEAEKYYIYAVTHGVREEDILLEQKSHNTYQNFEETFHILKTTSYSSIVLVTSANHMPRAILTCSSYMKKHQLAYEVFPVVSYATLLPKNSWYQNQRAVAILKGELERMITYHLLKT